ncbi:MAG: HupE/UreJ family protein [Alphaproteobacteria bacterium]|nr:HupE/UreJ family protein [Alphaproteobacteria bacterium]
MRFSFIFLAAILLPVQANAQFAMSATDGFEAGFLLPWLFAEQTIALIAAGLFLGQHRKLSFRQMWPIFMVTMAVGLAVPPTVFSLLSLSLVLLAVAVTLGILIALKMPVPMVVAVSVASVAGVLEGISSAPGASDWGAALGVAAGSALRANLFFVTPFLLADWLSGADRWPWVPIALRVAGSWITAIGIMMVALLLAPLP